MLRSAVSQNPEPLVFPITGLQEVQPLFVTGEGLYVMGFADSVDAMLVSANAVVHPLMRLCDARVLEAHGARINAERIQKRMKAEFVEPRAATAVDPLMFFIEIMVPGLTIRDCGSGSQDEAALAEYSGGLDEIIGRSSDAKQLHRNVSLPNLPCPSLWVLGRAWLLTRVSTAMASVHLRYQGSLLGLTGEYVSLKTLRQEWDATVFHDCKTAASELGAPQTPESQLLKIARTDLANSGMVVRGDAIYLATNPARVGYVIPPHYNGTIGRSVGRELALTAPLGFPPAALF